MKIFNPYHQFTKFILRFCQASNEKRIRKEDLETYFGLLPQHIEELIHVLCQEEFLIAVDQSQWDISPKVKDLENEPYIEQERELLYFFTKFPRFYIPEYVIEFENYRPLKAPLKLKMEKMCQNTNDKMVIKIPNQFLRISNTGTETFYSTGTKMDFQIIPLDCNQSFKGIIKIGNSHLIYRKLNEDHPDYQTIKNILENLQWNSVFSNELKLLSDQPNFEYHLIFNEALLCWDLEIISCTHSQAYILYKILDNWNFPPTFVGKYVRLQKKIKISLNELSEVRCKCNFRLRLKADNAFAFFAEYIVRNIGGFSNEISELQYFVKQISLEFMENFVSEGQFQLPEAIQLQKYFWVEKHYALAYLFGYGDDF